MLVLAVGELPLDGGRFAQRISVREEAWERADSLAPVGQSMVSRVGGVVSLLWVLAPWAASLSASSLPRIPECPFTHSRVVRCGLTHRALTMLFIMSFRGEWI